MCFSSEASFAAGTVLLGVGIVSMYKAASAPHKVLACIPLLFSIQQFDEGVLWLSFSNPAYLPWHQLSIQIFLAFAHVIWPVFLPFSVLLLEKAPWRRKIMRVTLGVGILLSVYFLYCLLRYDAAAVVKGHHIRYDFTYPYARGWYSGLLYFIPTILTPIVSTNPRMQLIGWLLLVSYAIARFFFGEYIVSVWCYFAVVISLVVLWEVGKKDFVNFKHEVSPR